MNLRKLTAEELTLERAEVTIRKALRWADPATVAGIIGGVSDPEPRALLERALEL